MQSNLACYPTYYPKLQKLFIIRFLFLHHFVPEDLVWFIAGFVGFDEPIHITALELWSNMVFLESQKFWTRYSKILERFNGADEFYYEVDRYDCCCTKWDLRSDEQIEDLKEYRSLDYLRRPHNNMYKQLPNCPWNQMGANWRGQQDEEDLSVGEYKLDYSHLPVMDAIRESVNHEGYRLNRERTNMMVKKHIAKKNEYLDAVTKVLNCLCSVENRTQVDPIIFQRVSHYLCYYFIRSFREFRHYFRKVDYQRRYNIPEKYLEQTKLNYGTVRRLRRKKRNRK